MSNEMLDRVINNPKFHELTRRRNRFAWTLSFIVLGMFYAYVLSVAFIPDSLAQPLAEGMTWSVGLTAGLAINAFGFLLTGVYAARANSEFDRLINDVLHEAQK